MEKKKILIICRSFYPEISPRSFRATELAKEFARQGHDVTVCFPVNNRDYSEFGKEYKLKIKDLGKMKFKNVELKGGRIEYFLRRVLRRCLQFFFEYPDIELMFKVAKVPEKERGYDMLISIAVPHSIHWGVAKVWDKKNIAKVWIADCGDPYMLARLDTFKHPFYFKYFEKKFCRKADFITVPTEGAKKAYYPEFHNKIKVIPQGIRIDTLNLPEYKKTNVYPVFAYAGGFIPGKRDPRPFLNYLINSKYEFRFVVFTGQAELIKPYAEILCNRLEIRNIVPREELLKILSTMDFLVNFDNNTDEQIPSKLIDYAVTGRPVLNIKSKIDKKIIKEFLEGDYTHKIPLNPQLYDIRNIVKEFISLSDSFTL
ncbi:MAG: glycosyltransferase [Bacteroidales bacterium]|nr:glycosyltransferase [Bacteroidales bacterium]